MAEEKVKSNLSRFVWLFAVLVLTASYTANLTSLRTVKQLDTTDFFDITMKGESVGIKECSTRGGVAAIVDNLPSIKLFLYDYCHKYTMRASIHRNSGFGFPFQKNSPLAPDVSRAILKMKENGKMDQISRRWFGEGGCGSSNATEADSKRLTVNNFKGLFFITGISSFSALAIFLFIFFYKNRLVWSSDTSLNHKLLQLFDRRERHDELLKKSAVVNCEEMVAAEKSKAISCMCCGEVKWPTITRP
ncbi:hypothetical protein SASPL_106819 [Salvia splendens]|uniref:Ionotropic glutamate receptor C-terminal domain-containing protein n=1 Tax=Salvia splendens TaxID=180675 RepID=A0A8X8YDU4_SALSN|nr:hypothetical protein SASPL_106819 [Salvia splendens]